MRLWKAQPLCATLLNKKGIKKLSKRRRKKKKTKGTDTRALNEL